MPASTGPAPADVARRVLDELLAWGPRELVAHDLTLLNGRRLLQTDFPLAEVFSGALAAAAAALLEIDRLRTGRAQRATVDMVRSAALLASPFLQFPVAGHELANANAELNALTGAFQGRCGRWIYLHGGFPRNTATLLRILGLPRVAPMNSREYRKSQDEVAARVRQWDAAELEDQVAAAGGKAALVRTRDEWLRHPQGQALSRAPVIAIEPMHGTEPRPWPSAPPGSGPLAGLRVLDLTRVVAGPYGTRLMAHFGADVLTVLSPDQPNVKWFYVDSSYGKRGALLDLKRDDDRALFFRLVDQTDVLVQSYRTGCLDKFGIDPEALAARRPGLIFVSLNCYGHDGPWAQRGGWEQLAQAASGIMYEHGRALGKPELIAPVAPTDMLTGHLAAYGALLALLRRHTEGGSYHVKVSLSRSAMWLHDWYLATRDAFPKVREPMSVDGLRATMVAPKNLLQCLARALRSPPLRPGDAAGFKPRLLHQIFLSAVPWLGFSAAESRDLFEISETAFGPMKHLLSPIAMSETPPCWQPAPAPPLREHARWL